MLFIQGAMAVNVQLMSSLEIRPSQFGATNGLWTTKPIAKGSILGAVSEPFTVTLVTIQSRYCRNRNINFVFVKINLYLNSPNQ